VVKVIDSNGRAPDGWTITTPWDVYKASFNGCDLFNKELRHFRWPFEHRALNGLSAELNIADFIEAVSLENAFNAWTSLTEDNQNINYYDFMMDLSNELYMRAVETARNTRQ
jgi:hypothetical protein